METSPVPEASASPAPRRHGRRARQLTPEEVAELERLRAEYEAVHGPIDDAKPASDDAAPSDDAAASAADESPQGDGSAEAEDATDQTEDPDTAADPASADEPGTAGEPVTEQIEPVEDSPADGVEDPLADSAEKSDAEEPREHNPWAVPEEPAVPTLRRFGRRARIIEVDEAPADAAAAGAAATVTATATATATAIPTDSDGVELGELPVGDAPAPKPAPRFEGRVLNRSGRSGSGSPVMWIVWALVALAVIALVVLLATGVLGGGSASALSGEGISLAGHPLVPTLEVPLS